MNIGVISDTHDQIENLAQAIAFFILKDVEAVLHCGDWISPFTLEYYKPLHQPIFGVFGNNDGDKFLHQRVARRLDLDLTMEDHLLTHEFGGKHIAIYHGTSEGIVSALNKCGDYDAVFYGHNHAAKIETYQNTLSMNPGTLMSNKRPSVGLYDTETNSGELIWLDELR